MNSQQFFNDLLHLLFLQLRVCFNILDLLDLPFSYLCILFLLDLRLQKT